MADGSYGVDLTVGLACAENDTVVTDVDLQGLVHTIRSPNIECVTQAKGNARLPCDEALDFADLSLGKNEGLLGRDRRVFFSVSDTGVP